MQEGSKVPAAGQYALRIDTHTTLQTTLQRVLCNFWKIVILSYMAPGSKWKSFSVSFHGTHHNHHHTHTDSDYHLFSLSLSFL